MAGGGADPSAKFELLTFPDTDGLVCEVAEAWLGEVEEARVRGRAHFVALLGGRVAPKLFDAVARAVKWRGAAMGHAHFFWSDERCVPATDPESNFGIAQQWLFEPLGIGTSQIHRIPTELGPDGAAAEAAAELCRVAPLNADSQPVLDLVFLGMGEDGHVASLFPGEPHELVESDAVYRAVRGPKPPYNRVTIGYRPLAAARHVWVLVAGEGKAHALRASLDSPRATPLAIVIALRALTRIYAELSVVRCAGLAK